MVLQLFEKKCKNSIKLLHQKLNCIYYSVTLKLYQACSQETLSSWSLLFNLYKMGVDGGKIAPYQFFLCNFCKPKN